jgi:hypothetical protein
MALQGGHGSLLVTNYQMSFNWGGKKPINVPHLTVAKVRQNFVSPPSSACQVSWKPASSTAL